MAAVCYTTQPAEAADSETPRKENPPHEKNGPKKTRRPDRMSYHEPLGRARRIGCAFGALLGLIVGFAIAWLTCRR